MLKRVVFAVLVSLAIAQPSFAAQIATWDLTGLPGNQLATLASFSAPNVTGSNMVRGPGLTASAGPDNFAATGWESDAQALGSGEYFEFGFDVAPGFQVELDELLINTRSSNAGPGTVGLYTSLDGYLAPVATFVQNGSFIDQFIDLSSLPNVSDSFRVRFYEIGNLAVSGSDTGSGGNFRLAEIGFNSGNPTSDVQFTGVVRVPEPSTIAVTGMVALVLGIGVRRTPSDR